MRIALDAAGGDHAPEETVQGALAAGARIGRAGDVGRRRKRIERALAGEQMPEGMSVVHAPDLVTMDDDPVRAVRQKRESSIVVAARLVRAGEADALVSAGKYRCDDGGRPFSYRACRGRRTSCYRDADADARRLLFHHRRGSQRGSSARALHQFAHMGAVYVQEVFGVRQPVSACSTSVRSRPKGRIGREAYELLRNDPALNFVGNVEGNDVPAGKADVIVCDGFAGNIVLKLAEGVAATIFHFLRHEVFAGGRGKAAGLLVRPGLRKVRDRMDYAEYGGAPLLGLNGAAIIAHGRSDRRAIRNALKVAAAAVRHDVPGRIDAAMTALSGE